MDNPRQINRRAVLAGVSTAALLPTIGRAQSPITMTDFAARARALTGFDPVPRGLLNAMRTALDPLEERAFIDDAGAGGDVQKTVLKALYTGVYTPPDGPPQRLAYAQALMYAAIEDAVNVPSYCGGTPAYWSEKPQVA